MANVTPTHSRYDFIVIGAGMAGLSAAYKLDQKGYRVLVLEKSSIAGGRVQTLNPTGYAIDTGAQFFADAYKETLKLIKQLGLEEKLVTASPYAATFKSGRFCRLNKNNPLTLYTSGTLGFGSTFKLLSTLLKLRKTIGTFQPEVITNWVGFDKENAHEWTQKNLNKEILEYLVEPFISGFTYSAPRETSSFLVARMLAHFLNNSEILSLQDGLSLLPKTLSEKVEVLYNHHIDKVEWREGHYRFQINGQEIQSAKVIYAIPAHAAKAIMPKSEYAENSNLLDTKYASTIHLSFEVNAGLDALKSKVYGTMIGQKESRLINVVSLENNKHLGPQDKNQWKVNVMLTSLAAISLKDATQEEVTRAVIAELENLYPEFSSSTRLASFTRWNNAIPIFDIGHVEEISRYRDTINSNSRFFLTGDYMGTPCVEGAVESATFITGLFAPE